MTMTRRVSGAAIAAAAAMLFSTAAVPTANAEDAKIHCDGVNSCKGTSACATATSQCKGQNACKGQGFVEMTKEECDAAKAKMEKDKEAGKKY